MNNSTLTDQISLDHTPNYVHVEFNKPYQVISSAALNGGLVQADHILNLKVPQYSTSNLEPPEITLTKYCADQNWNGTTVGMMTAASMDSLRIFREEVYGIHVIALVTCGLSNPRCAGDKADDNTIETAARNSGTINTIILTSGTLSPATMVEALVVATEAKSVALQRLGVKSPISQNFATGTGTDAIAIASSQDTREIRYCGKHVIFGEILGRLVIDAVFSSAGWELAQTSK